MNEIWRDIPGYEGRYQISNFGNVLSLNYRRLGFTKQLTPKRNNSGRLWVELVKDGKRSQYLIHRLVGEVFIPNPMGYPQINHKDENPQNNFVENLEWCTPSYNMKYYFERHKDAIRGTSPERNGCLKNLKIVQMTKDGEIIRVWDNSRQLKIEKGWNDWTITECCRGNRKTAYGFIWQYVN